MSPRLRRGHPDFDARMGAGVSRSERMTFIACEPIGFHLSRSAGPAYVIYFVQESTSRLGLLGPWSLDVSGAACQKSPRSTVRIESQMSTHPVVALMASPVHGTCRLKK